MKLSMIVPTVVIALTVVVAVAAIIVKAIRSLRDDVAYYNRWSDDDHMINHYRMIVAIALACSSICGYLLIGEANTLVMMRCLVMIRV